MTKPSNNKQQPHPALASLPLSATELRAISGKVIVGYGGLRELGIRFCRNHLWRMIHDGRFPAPIATNASPYARKIWRRAEVNKWLKAHPLMKLAREGARHGRR